MKIRSDCVPVIVFVVCLSELYIKERISHPLISRTYTPVPICKGIEGWVSELIGMGGMVSSSGLCLEKPGVFAFAILCATTFIANLLA